MNSYDSSMLGFSDLFFKLETVKEFSGLDVKA